MYDFTADAKGITVWNEETGERAGEFTAADIMALVAERNKLREEVSHLQSRVERLRPMAGFDD